MPAPFYHLAAISHTARDTVLFAVTSVHADEMIGKNIVMGLIMCPPSYIEGLVPVPQNVALFADRALKVGP